MTTREENKINKYAQPKSISHFLSQLVVKVKSWSELTSCSDGENPQPARAHPWPRSYLSVLWKCYKQCEWEYVFCMIAKMVNLRSKLGLNTLIDLFHTLSFTSSKCYAIACLLCRFDKSQTSNSGYTPRSMQEYICKLECFFALSSVISFCAVLRFLLILPSLAKYGPAAFWLDSQ